MHIYYALSLYIEDCGLTYQPERVVRVCQISNF